ncbi:hypothetical protein GCM10007392_24750 [Saccharospirillum salsuginis]|uniref:Uncharacterized protein n=1 Tax=Saccharospirillum salsuginis TaxID=418750 RepID=A0A918NBK7_9GAMM|nr:hypothetical protein GCM10007392_24750 [Saccharospirillum salsuginis]
MVQHHLTAELELDYRPQLATLQRVGEHDIRRLGGQTQYLLVHIRPGEGDLVQSLAVTEGVTHFGIDHHDAVVKDLGHRELSGERNACEEGGLVV